MEIVGKGVDFINALKSVGIDSERIEKVETWFETWGERLESVCMVDGKVICIVRATEDQQDEGLEGWFSAELEVDLADL